MAEVNEEVRKLMEKIHSHGFQPSTTRLLNVFDYRETSPFLALDGWVIMMKKKDFSALEAHFRQGDNSRVESLPPVTAILRAVDDDPSKTKSAIKDELFQHLSFRKFNKYWSEAAKMKPSISAPGRKS
jgi:hypothetical protein